MFHARKPKRIYYASKQNLGKNKPPRVAGLLATGAAGYFFWVFTFLPEGLSLMVALLASSFFLVSGSVWLGVLTVVAMMVGLGKGRLGVVRKEGG